MSFSSDVKAEIMSIQMKNICCRRSMLNGIISSKGTANGNTVVISLENDILSEYTARLVHEHYGREAIVRHPEKGGRLREVVFESKSCASYLSKLCSGGALFDEKCAGCSAAFVRGLFFACGKVSNPEKQYMIELSPSILIFRHRDILTECGIELKTSSRNGKEYLYAKKSSVIEDFFAYSGLNNTMFAFVNEKIKGEIRNNANRISNCEMNNIDKAVTASHKQISVIEELDRLGLLSSLPEELEKTARLRLLHRDLSLSQLSAISVPPISKSGLSHRLAKIIELASQLMPLNKKI